MSDTAPNTTRYQELEARNLFDELLELRDLQRKNRETALAVVDGEELPWELNRQGFMRWYMHPLMTDICMHTYVMYVQKIPAQSRSGKQLTQGHQQGFVWKGGRGYTIVDDVRYDWQAYDLIQIPLRVSGCVVQHFNDSDEDAEIMFCSLNTVHSASIDRGSGFEQLEDCPEYREKMRSDRS
jgi:gentisate 1,2-dioxygenase